MGLGNQMSRARRTQRSERSRGPDGRFVLCDRGCDRTKGDQSGGKHRYAQG